MSAVLHFVAWLEQNSVGFYDFPTALSVFNLEMWTHLPWLNLF